MMRPGIEKASGGGHLEVVKSAAQYAHQRGRRQAVEVCQALPLATIGGHFEVVRFLLEPGRYYWDCANALELAIDNRQDDMAELIYAATPDFEGESFFRA